MKNLIIILFGIIINSTLYSQSDISLYVPLHTKHFVPGHYAKNEGGNIGLIATKAYRSQIFTAGVLRNSFGKTSYVIGYGLTKNYNKVNVSFSGGFASGYKKFRRGNSIITPVSLFNGSGIMPYIIGAIKIPVYGAVGVQINVSPMYVNSGIYINL